MASIEELSQILKSDSNGDNLYDHLTETLLELLLKKPEDPLNAFEGISSRLRQSKQSILEEKESEPSDRSNQVMPIYCIDSSFVSYTVVFRLKSS